MTSADCHLISASARFHMELWDFHSLCKQDAAFSRAGSCALCTHRRLHNPACAGRVYIKRCTRSQLIFSHLRLAVWGGAGRSQDGTNYCWIRWRVAAAAASKGEETLLGTTADQVVTVVSGQVTPTYTSPSLALLSRFSSRNFQLR